MGHAISIQELATTEDTKDKFDIERTGDQITKITLKEDLNLNDSSLVTGYDYYGVVLKINNIDDFTIKKDATLSYNGTLEIHVGWGSGDEGESESEIGTGTFNNYGSIESYGQSKMYYLN